MTPTVKLPDGETVPAFGLGTWHMGEKSQSRREEVDALMAGFDKGVTLVDTAEMYAEGGAEEVVGEAIGGRRDDIFIVSKVYPHNASSKGTIAACERSLKRLGTDRIDLYLLHWRGSYPFSETIAAFESLRRDGKIRHWGVSNLDRADMSDLLSAPHGTNCAANQVLYNIADRGIDWDLLPDMRKRHIPVMAYCPLGQGALTGNAVLERVARRHDVKAAAIALAWTMRAGGVITIPKTSSIAHLEENLALLDITLTGQDLDELDSMFPPPSGPSRLSIV